MVDTQAHASREWLSFDDDDGSTWLFDVTFLLSEWSCVFGSGCKGVLEEDASGLSQGCCTHGAHFSDKDDRRSTLRHIARLGPEHWKNIDVLDDPADAVAKNGDGEWTTIRHNGACIFHNPVGFVGGTGCALHGAALDSGERPMDWKPDVCWQLPLRLVTTTDENEHTTYTLRAWQRRDWGEAGESFHWWCTDAGQAQAAERPTYRELSDEIIEMIGEDRYLRFARMIEDPDTNERRSGVPVALAAREATPRVT